MPSNWLFVRLRRPRWMDAHDHPAARLPSVMSGLLDWLRRADPDARWAFRRRAGPHVDVWFRSTPDVLGELTQLLRVAAIGGRVPIEFEPGGPWTAYPERRDGDAAVALADASSDLAMDLLADGDLDAGGRLAAAVCHLEHLADMLDEGARMSFLFHCWQQWAGALSPRARVELARDADSTVLPAAPTPEAWARYRGRIESIGEVAGYVLLDHAHLANDQLGIDVRTAALAARAVRLAWTSGGLPGRRLIQPA